MMCFFLPSLPLKGASRPPLQDLRRPLPPRASNLHDNIAPSIESHPCISHPPSPCNALRNDKGNVSQYRWEWPSSALTESGGKVSVYKVSLDYGVKVCGLRSGPICLPKKSVRPSPFRPSLEVHALREAFL